MTLPDTLRAEAARLPEGNARTYLERLAADIEADRATRGSPPVPPIVAPEEAPAPAEAPAEPTPEAPKPDPRLAWNDWLRRFKAARRTADTTLSKLGRGAEYDACMDEVAALKVEGKVRAAEVSAALGRPLTEAEVTGGVEVAS